MVNVVDGQRIVMMADVIECINAQCLIPNVQKLADALNEIPTARPENRYMLLDGMLTILEGFQRVVSHNHHMIEPADGMEVLWHALYKAATACRETMKEIRYGKDDKNGKAVHSVQNNDGLGDWQRELMDGYLRGEPGPDGDRGAEGCGRIDEKSGKGYPRNAAGIFGACGGSAEHTQG